MKLLRRGIWYLATRLLLICLILGLMVTVFYYAMNLSNIQIILKDGMAGRAKYIMGINRNTAELSSFFETDYLKTDEDGRLITRDETIKLAFDGKSPYADYNIRGIDHRLDMGFLWVWPWENSAKVEITERIPRIDGRVKGTRADELIAQKGADAIYPPEWSETTYRVILIRESGQWKISSLTPIQK